MSTNNLPNISDDLFKLVLKLNTNIFHQQEFLKNLNLPPSHVKTIFYLVHHGSAPISVIAERLCISKPNMTPIIDKLLEQGFVCRAEDPTDRRIILIETTPKAYELFKEHKQMIKERLATKIEILSFNELEQLSQGIQLIMPLLDKIK